jgi:uncharacterized radical SAM superfamily protein
MYELLKAIKDKYRIHIVARVDVKDSSAHNKAKESIGKLISEGVLMDHRAMYCTTQIGQSAMIRQLNAELHMESNQ